MRTKIIILDHGSKHTQVLARNIRELDVYCEIHPFHASQDFTDDPSVKGIILSDSPVSVADGEVPDTPLQGLQGKVPLLGIGFGAGLLAKRAGATMAAVPNGANASITLEQVADGQQLFKEISAGTRVPASQHGTIEAVSSNMEVLARASDGQVAAFRVNGEDTFGIQFHPAMGDQGEGKKLLRNFVLGICGAEANHSPKAFVKGTVETLVHQLGQDQVVLALSGGVDSTVTAALLKQAIGDRLHCIFVDHGLLRKNEFPQVLERYKGMGLNVKGVNARNRFLTALDGVDDPEAKRKVIGRTFIEVFEEEAKAIDQVKWLGQGTIYPDVIESVNLGSTGASVKSHHNVGGLPERMNLKVVEPLRFLFKDEVRRVGRELGIDPAILTRHPFPGPGLGVRILGAITPEKVATTQEVDHIFIQGLRDAGLYDKVWQAAAILLPVRSVGVQNGQRTYHHAVALRAITSVDGMTAQWYPLPHEFLARISSEIMAKVQGVNRVVYDISNKPPATIEWE